MSHKHRLKGVELYESISQIAELVAMLRTIKDHEILEQLQENLSNSLAGLQTDYEALNQGQLILTQLTDLLYGHKDDKGIRHTQIYKEQSDGQKIKQEIEVLLEQSHQQYKKHSTQMRGYLRHFQLTYQNWKTYLFTCYDYPDIPNDNNRLELSHSQMKKQYRRITGYANNATQELMELVKQTNYQHLKEQKKLQVLKSKQRGNNFATKKRLFKTLQKVKELWAS